MEQLPESILVIGAGATGTEFAYLFNRLGLQVTWIIDQYGILPNFDPIAGQTIGKILHGRGVNLLQGQMVERLTPGEDEVVALLASGQTVTAQQAFVGIGRRPDLSRLALENAGLAQDGSGLLAIDPYCRTSVQSVYAVGDVASGPMVANRAVAQAHIAGRHAAGKTVTAYHPETTVQAVFSQPAIAQVGLVAPQSSEVASVQIPYQASLKTSLMADPSPGDRQDETAFVRLVYHRADGRILGGLAVGDHAPDVLAPVALAIRLNASLADLASFGPAYPSLSELAVLAARQELA
jgi:dihydrolipoamide dehydrogenase